jgi:two-component system, cell cycle response regulator DivK
MGSDVSNARQQPLDPAQAHVIVVEDNADNLLVIMQLLRRAGIQQLNWRTTGKEVARFVKDMSPAGRPDVIFLDIALPGEDGYEVLADLRADSHLRQTRVIAVTMRNSPEEIKRARAAGFDGFIGKPIQAHHFPDQLRRVLAGEAVWEQ